MTEVKWLGEGEARRKSMEPWIKDDIVYYPHQVEAIRLLAKQNSFLLADDMGLGKSLEALTVFAVDVVRGWVKTGLIVCPATLKGNWADEIEKFTGFPYVVLDGKNKIERDKQILRYTMMEGPKLLIANYEQIISHERALDAIRFDVAFFDEAHYLKNPESKRTLACLEVYSRRSFMLTGTPMLNHVPELFSILHRIDPQGYPGYYQFVNRYAVMGGYKNKQVVGVKNEPELNERLNRVMTRRLKSEVLNLPPVQIIERKVDLLPQQQALYDEIVNDLRLTRFDADRPDDVDNALTKFLRLKEICGTTFKFTNEDNSAKLDLAISDTTEILENGHRQIIFTQFRPVIDCFAQRMEKLGVPVFTLTGATPKTERQPTVNNWSKTSQPGVIICMLQVAGVGLNMVAARHMSFIDKLFVPGLNQQAIDRAHRIGASETQNVQVYEYIARNTIESRVNAILRTKTRIFKEVVEGDPMWTKKLVAAMLEEEAKAA